MEKMKSVGLEVCCLHLPIDYLWVNHYLKFSELQFPQRQNGMTVPERITGANKSESVVNNSVLQICCLTLLFLLSLFSLLLFLPESEELYASVSSSVKQNGNSLYPSVLQSITFVRLSWVNASSTCGKA